MECPRCSSTMGNDRIMEPEASMQYTTRCTSLQETPKKDAVSRSEVIAEASTDGAPAADAGREGVSSSRRGRSKIGDSKLAERETVTFTLSVGMRTGAKAIASKSERTAIGRGSSSL